MSRIGNSPIDITQGVEIALEGNIVKVKGSKGELTLVTLPQVKVEIEGDQVLVKRKKNDRFSRSAHGLMRSLINNMVLGVSQGWTKNLELVGVGYRAQGGGDTVTLSVGYSHPVVVKAPEGVTFSVSENTKISVTGIDKTLVGQIAANLRSVKPPEVYKGKGIRLAGEYVKRKAGKAGKAAAK